MKTFQKCAAQGELLLTVVGGLPPDAVEIPGDRKHIVGHSETGHHHLVDKAQARFYGTSDPNVCYLQVSGEYADLVHNRSFDTHETLRMPGDCVIRVDRQREYTPEGWRRVQD